FGGQQEKQRRCLRHAAEERQQKSEGRGQIGFGRGCDLVERAESEPAVGQMTIERGKAEREGGMGSSRYALQAGKLLTECSHGGFAGRFLGHLSVQLPGSPGSGRLGGRIEQNKNISRGRFTGRSG